MKSPAIYRQVLDREDVKSLSEASEKAYAYAQSFTRLKRLFAISGKPRAAKAVAVETLPWGGIPLNHCMILSDGIARPSFERILLKLKSIIGTSKYEPDISAVRRHSTSSTNVVWHTDAEAAGTKKYGYCITAWVPFDSVGLNRPTLEFQVGELVRFQMEPGDVVMFDHFTTHRTQPLTNPLPRTSAEIRFSLNIPEHDEIERSIG
jgi:hypothetical protein